jgi:integrase
MAVKIRPYRGDTTGRAWEADINVTIASTGTRIRKRVRCPTTSRTGSRRWAEQYARVLIDGEPTKEETKKAPKEALKQQTPTFAEFCTRWTRDHIIANKLKNATHIGYGTVMRRHLIPAFGDLPIDQVKAAEVQALKASIASFEPRSVNYILITLGTIFRCAADWGVIESTPVIKKVRAPKKKITVFTIAEINRLIEVAHSNNPVAELVVLLGVEAGLRSGEIVALGWKSIDFDRGVLTVERNETYGVEDVPKSGAFREIPLTRRLRAALEAHRHDIGPRVLYYQGMRGEWRTIKPWVLRKLLHTAQQQAGLPLTGMHRLRHSFCSMLGELGAPGPEIQALAGHANLSTTEVYLHLSPNATRSAIARIDHRIGEITEENRPKPKKRRIRKK